MPQAEKLYLTPQEVVDRYNKSFSIGTLKNWRWNGKGPPFTRIGGKILYPLQELIAWEAKRTVSSTAEYEHK